MLICNSPHQKIVIFYEIRYRQIVKSCNVLLQCCNINLFPSTKRHSAAADGMARVHSIKQWSDRNSDGLGDITIMSLDEQVIIRSSQCPHICQCRESNMLYKSKGFKKFDKSSSISIFPVIDVQIKIAGND